MSNTNKDRVIPILEIVTAAGLILFWIAFFTVGLAPENPPQCYFAYEHAFPLPDICLAFLLLVSGILLLRQNPLGRTLSLIAAGGLIFLGLLDFSFNLQNGIYLASVLDLVLNAFINAWCVAFGVIIIWRNR
ncbi:MAG: hypothetical protein FJ023_02815 [Chloroflexi bacterium]|nr:hypothetical protein [Chloroflexota bacterium]